MSVTFSFDRFHVSHKTEIIRVWPVKCKMYLIISVICRTFINYGLVSINSNKSSTDFSIASMTL